MKMRQRPIRGQQLSTLQGQNVTILEAMGKDFVKIIAESGETQVIAKSQIRFPVIDTTDYERM